MRGGREGRRGEEYMVRTIPMGERNGWGVGVYVMCLLE